MADFAVGNKVGVSYCLTVLTPILRDALGAPVSYRARLRELLSQLPDEAESPFARVSTIHLCRLLIIEDSRYEGSPTKKDHFRDAYLLMSAELAGDLEDSLDALVAAAPEAVDAIWRNCVGYPGIGDARAFVEYLKRCQIPTSFFFGGYPQASLREVLKALAVQEQFTEFAVAAQDLAPQALKERFDQLTEEITSLPAPRPGTR
jgi:hypothetical protein